MLLQPAPKVKNMLFHISGGTVCHCMCAAGEIAPVDFVERYVPSTCNPPLYGEQADAEPLGYRPLGFAKSHSLHHRLPVLLDLGFLLMFNLSGSFLTIITDLEALAHG